MNDVALPRQLRELHLFSGAGGGILAGMLLGHRTVCAVEIEPYPRKVLLARQRDGILPRFPIWDDVTTFDGKPWRGRVDVVCGGFPCQDISTAGSGAGIDGKRSGLWFEMLRIIGEIRPRFVFVENSPALTTRGGTRVAASLASLGYVGRNGVVGAEDAIWFNSNPSADHQRERMWFYGKDSDSNSMRKLQQEGIKRDERRRVCDTLQTVSDTHLTYGERRGVSIGVKQKFVNHGRGSWWASEPRVCRVADGVAHRMDRLKAIGNGQVPAVAALAYRILSQ